MIVADIHAGESGVRRDLLDRLRESHFPDLRGGKAYIDSPRHAAERGANGSLIVRNDDITVNPTPSAAEERSEDAVTLKAANDEASWQLQRMSRPCNYDASTLSSAASPDR